MGAIRKKLPSPCKTKNKLQLIWLEKCQKLGGFFIWGLNFLQFLNIKKWIEKNPRVLL